MDEQLRIILIIIVSVSIFGLLVFVFVKNYIRQKINNLVEEEKDKKSKVDIHLFLYPLLFLRFQNQNHF
jgi:cell division protein FtsW (lipid II flippase)